MQLCKNCGKQVVYIARTNNKVITCDAEEKVIYTNFGREVKGFQPHICEKKDAKDLQQE